MKNALKLIRYCAIIICIVPALLLEHTIYGGDPMIVDENTKFPHPPKRRGQYKKEPKIPSAQKKKPAKQTTQKKENPNQVATTKKLGRDKKQALNSENTQTNKIQNPLRSRSAIASKKPRDPEKDLILRKQIKSLSRKELKEGKDYVIYLERYDLAVKFLKQLIAVTKNQSDLRSYRLELADIYFQMGKMKEAAQCYREYVRFYPGSKARDYAQYKEILSRFYARLAPPRDQTVTQKAIRLAKIYLDGSDHEREYITDVKDILKTCQRDIFDYEVDVFKQFCSRGQFTGAQTRLSYIEKNILPEMSYVEPEFVELKGFLAEYEHKPEITLQVRNTLLADFPDYKPKYLIASVPKSKKRDYVKTF